MPGRDRSTATARWGRHPCGSRATASQLVEMAGVATQLLSYHDAASKAEARDNLGAEAGNLDSYQSLLRAQSGRSVAPAAADARIAFSFPL